MSSIPTHDCICQPALVSEYIAAAKLVYDVRVRVAQKDWKRFIDFERMLIKEGANLTEYAVTVCKLWRSRCAELHLKHCPVNMFLGKVSQERFWRVHGYKFVDLVSPDKVKAQILTDEITVGKVYIDSRGELRLSEAARCAGVSEDWWQAYENKERPTNEALDMLCQLYHLSKLPARNYNDIIAALQ